MHFVHRQQVHIPLPGDVEAVPPGAHRPVFLPGKGAAAQGTAKQQFFHPVTPLHRTRCGRKPPRPPWAPKGSLPLPSPPGGYGPLGPALPGGTPRSVRRGPGGSAWPLRPSRSRRALHPDHGDLDDVRRRALDGHIPGHPLPKGAHIEVAGLSAPAGSGAGRTGFPRSPAPWPLPPRRFIYASTPE